MMSNFVAHLHAAGVLGFALLLTTDAATWHALHARGYPVILDRAFPERQEYRDGAGSAPDTPNRRAGWRRRHWGAAQRRAAAVLAVLTRKQPPPCRPDFAARLAPCARRPQGV